MEYQTPSKLNPIYSAAVYSKQTGKRYAIQSINYAESKYSTDISLSENSGQLAQSARIVMANLKTEDGYFTGIINVMDRVIIYANDGDKSEEVFRGVVWERPYSSGVEKLLTLTCYDNLIYFMKSQVSEYFSAGKSTQTILNELCQKWGVSLVYNYKSITHPKLPLSGTLADVILSDLLDEVKKQTKTKYVVRSIKDAVNVSAVGSNSTVYEINRTDGVAISTSSNISMDGVVTKVVITGSSDDDGKTAIEAVVSGDTNTYGTIQQVQSKSTDTTLTTAKAEAETTLAENGIPKKTFNLSSVDIPWVHKGDLVKVCAGDMTQSYIVLSVTHNVTAKTMDLEVELP